MLEAAAYFPFAFLRRRIAEEIELSQGDWLEEDNDEEVGYFYRRLAWKAVEEDILPHWKATEDEEEVDEEEVAFNDRFDNLDLWDQAIEDLMDRIFYKIANFTRFLQVMRGKALDVIGIDRVLQLHRVRATLRTLELDEFPPNLPMKF